MSESICVRLKCPHLISIEPHPYNTMMHCDLVNTSNQRWNINYLMDVFRGTSDIPSWDKASTIRCINYKKLKLVAKLEKV